MVFVMGNEVWKKKGLNQNASPVECLSRQLISSGHFVMMYESCHRKQERARGCVFTTRANGHS